MTLHTRINPLWCRRNIRKVSEKYPIELISTGEELFLHRLANQFRFELDVVKSKLRALLSVLSRANVGNWIGKTIVLLRGHYPIYLTCRKLSPARVSKR